ncbi:elongation factor P hydroxylase [Alteromonas ponticola]|nr:elongation factor P hydroxylase [Alteromonas sp. ASW11-130]
MCQQTSSHFDEEAHAVDTLIALFDSLFFTAFNTRLIRGENEPVYLPANNLTPYNQIVFAHGYFSSALHEIAHWCIAGAARRKLEDYGYWYCPDGRNEQQQKEFEQVEVKPQAVERAFTLAAGRKFRVSTDNLNGAEPDREAFEESVLQQYALYEQNGFPPRAQLFIDALNDTFGDILEQQRANA